jgi:hypothetical protein
MIKPRLFIESLKNTSSFEFTINNLGLMNCP